MHRSRHKMAAEYELLKLGSSIRRSRIGTRSMDASLCFSIDTATHAPCDTKTRRQFNCPYVVS